MMSSHDNSQQASPPPKFSRYRSVRTASAAQNDQDTWASKPYAYAEDLPPSLPQDSAAAKTQESIRRSKSRYRKNRPHASKVDNSAPPLPSQPPVSSTDHHRPYMHGSGHGVPGTRSGAYDSDNVQAQGYHDGRIGNGGGPVSLMYQEYPRRSQIIQGQDDEFLANARAAAEHNNQSHSGSKKVRKEKSGVSGGGLFSRLRGLDAAPSDTKDRGDSSRGNLKHMISAPQPVDPSELDKAPVDDTPSSAINASQRTVLVVCNASVRRLPVTPTTDVREILCSAASSMKEEDIVPEASTVTEYFKQLGLERPLRKYERVRGVMNSWDSDSYNHLIVAARSDESDEETEELLEARYAPREQPSETSLQLYYAQKSGRWDKRWITLRADGQVCMAKKQGGETTNICHMSDFDVYQPTRKALKRLKPPKKFCYAAKSQQKPSMFLDNENFVHYFSASDKGVALKWYTAMQQWRSWYLVNMLGEGSNDNEKKSSKTQDYNNTAYKRTSVPRTTELHGNRRSSTEPNSVRSSLDVDTNNNPTHQVYSQRDPGNTYTSSSAVRSKSTRRALPLRPPPAQDAISYPSSPTSPVRASSDFSSDVGNGQPGPRRKPSRRPRPTGGLSSQETSGDEPFAASGLLGRTYTKRQNAMREREKEEAEEPFSGTGLLRGQLPTQQGDVYGNYNSSGTTRPRHDSNAKGAGRNSIERTGTRRRRDPPKPLVDLTPTYMEPPQHARKGRGVAVEPGTLLVDNATGPQLQPGAVAIPSATTWRRPTEQQPAPQAAHQGTRQRSNTTRSQRQVPLLQRQPQGRTSVDVHSTPGSPTDTPFAPTGLVARSARTQGAGMTGRGVATGNRNVVDRPLVDLSENSQFADGSLLRSVEQQPHPRHPGAGDSSGASR